MSLSTSKGKRMYLEYLDTDEGAAHAYDRAKLWCKAQGKKRHKGIQLNFPADEGDGVDDKLKGMTLEERETLSRV